LEPDLAGAGKGGEEQALAPEEDVGEALDHFGGIVDGGLKGRHIAGIRLEGFAGGEVVFPNGPIQLQEHQALAAIALHDQALAPKDGALHPAPAEGHGDGHIGVRAQKGVLLGDVFPAGAYLQHLDLAGHGGGEGDAGAGPLGGIGGHKQAFAGEHPAQCLAKAALHIGFHADAVAHPGKAAALGINAFPGVELHGYGGHLAAPNFILHTIPPKHGFVISIAWEGGRTYQIFLNFYPANGEPNPVRRGGSGNGKGPARMPTHGPGKGLGWLFEHVKDGGRRGGGHGVVVDVSARPHMGDPMG